ncbi:MAG: hypothetical protein K2O62_05525, partial [Clostridia bacterium]|nr:hypothetical protein [Clostridia bacterium]
MSASAAATTPKTNAAYLDLNGSGNILNGFEGKQKEKVYFGTNFDTSLKEFGNTGSNAHTGAIKWRVLAKNDSKYGNGNNNLLLFADYQLGLDIYNFTYDNPEYSFWGTSQVRAALNGGNFLTKVNRNAAVPDLDSSYTEDYSYYGQLFSLGEKAAVAPASDYSTTLFGIEGDNTAGWTYVLYPIVAEGEDENSKYNTDRLNKTDHPSATYARITSHDGDEGVEDFTGGDKLFLLDYYDINTLAYGFGDDTDNDGVIDQVNASKIDPDWTNSNELPSTGEISSYLGFSDDLGGDYWLRNAGRFRQYSAALAVNSGGSVTDCNVDGYVPKQTARRKVGVRPAMVLDTTKIAYVTTEIPGTGWANMKNVPTTPEYKLYLKDSSYAANTANAKALIGAKGSTLYIKYNNPTNVNDGKLIVLLTPTGGNGEVDYQQSITMDSSATAAKMVNTTLTLPANVSLATHDVTLLYTTSNSGHSTDSIYCSYGMNPIDAPVDIE